MKTRVLFPAIFCFALLASCGGKNSADKTRLYFDEANGYYRNHQYAESLRIYEDLIGQGTENAALYFNAGNAAFRLFQEKQKSGNPVGLLSRSLRHFERAQRLRPWDREIRHNLDFARASLVDHIEPARKNPLLFFYRIPSQAHTGIALVFFLIASAGLGFFFFTQNPEAKILSRNLGLVALLLYAVFLGMSRLKYNEDFNSRVSFIQSETVELKAEPSADSKTIFTLHEGTRVTDIRKVGEWSLVRIGNGQEGWIEGLHLLHL
ncbi:MAG: SH3 domain-containing protein [Spirochaetia bacterium]|nr:SH3 domain-containing protein [Spirochaetia bacterium]